MKRFISIVVFLLLALPLCAAGEGPLPDEVLALCRAAYPGYDVLTTGGQILPDGESYAVIMTKDGDNVLLLCERDAGEEFVITLNNPNAVWDERPLFHPDRQLLSITINRTESGYRKLWILRGDYGESTSSWKLTCERDSDGIWDSVISEYTDMCGDVQTVYWSHIFEGQYYSSMTFVQDKGGKTLGSSSYPDVPVSGETAACGNLETFDVSIYPWKQIVISDKRLEDFAAPYVPQGYALVQCAVQPTALILLVESPAGERHLRLMPYRNKQFGGTTVSKTLPEDTLLDLIHAGEDGLLLSWEEGYCSAAFRQTADNRWMLAWHTSREGSYNAGYNYLSDGLNVYENPRFYGDHPWSDIAQIDFAALPGTFDEALAQLDQGRYAVVNNPDPADRLHLRERPDKNARSLGKFYNGTPVVVHSIDGAWTEVTIGLNGVMPGWMMTKYLAFGEEMNAVACAFPAETAKDEYQLGMTFLSGGASEIIGLKGEDYILINAAGLLRTQPSEDFWPGNG